jgi:hypothetical protein
MRHSFLPASEQKTLKRLYRIRAAIVGLFMLSVAGMVGVGSLFPSYVYVSTEEEAQLSTIASLKEDKDSSGIANVERELQADAALLAILSSNATTTRPSTVIEDMVTARGNVHVTSIVLGDISSTTVSVIMQGVAPTRESLLAFKTRLEGLNVGNKVELPISGFARSQDIPFSLRVSHILR